MFDTLGDTKDGMVPNGQDFLPLSGLATLDAGQYGEYTYQASHTGVRRSVTPRLALETETQHRHGFEESARGLPGE